MIRPKNAQIIMFQKILNFQSCGQVSCFL